MNNTPEETSNTSSDKTKWIVIGVIVIAAFVTTYVIYNRTLSAAGSAPKAAANAIGTVYNDVKQVPKTILKGISTVYGDIKKGLSAKFATKDNSQTVYVVQGNIEEEWLAVTASKEIEVKYQYSITWGMSTKTIDLVATYRVLAGVDLAKVEYDFQTNKILVDNADGILISCERIKLQELEEKDGWWNEVKDEDRERAQNALDEEARRQAKSEDILKEATANFIKKVQVGSGVPEEEFKFIVMPE